jgi:catechol 1,2-dioxygenase
LNLNQLQIMSKKEQNSRIRALDRRTFIKSSSLLSFGTLIIPTGLWALRPAGIPEAQTGCDPTTDDILGPYYLPGSPATTMIAGPNEPGTRLFVSGQVLSNDCMTPVPNAMIELWQANDAAVYDTSSDFKLRGTVYSDSNGNYAFETIMPGAYLNGSQYRPKHIHYKVTKPGFPDLVTQLYFQGDPYIPADPWASDPDAVARIISLNTISQGLEGVFDIVLDGFVGIKPNKYGLEGDILPAYPNPSDGLMSIHFNIFRPSKVQVTVTDLDGKEVITLIDRKMEQGRFTTQWQGEDAGGKAVSAGTYLVVLHMDGQVVKSQRLVRTVRSSYGY